MKHGNAKKRLQNINKRQSIRRIGSDLLLAVAPDEATAQAAASHESVGPSAFQRFGTSLSTRAQAVSDRIDEAKNGVVGYVSRMKCKMIQRKNAALDLIFPSRVEIRQLKQALAFTEGKLAVAESQLVSHRREIAQLRGVPLEDIVDMAPLSTSMPAPPPLPSFSFAAAPAPPPLPFNLGVKFDLKSHISKAREDRRNEAVASPITITAADLLSVRLKKRTSVVEEGIPSADTPGKRPLVSMDDLRSVQLRKRETAAAGNENAAPESLPVNETAVAMMNTRSKLRQVQQERSPGGTPKKEGRPAETGTGLTPMMARALQRKFAGARSPSLSPKKRASPLTKSGHTSPRAYTPSRLSPHRVSPHRASPHRLRDI